MQNRKIAFIEIIILVLLELSCIVFNLLIMIKSYGLDLDEDLDNIINYLTIRSIINILINIISIVILFTYGIYSLYFKHEWRLFVFIIL